MEVVKTNRFSRTVGNEAKMGYFPTDADHCRRIKYLLDFENEVSAVDLCAGEGDALITVTGKTKDDNNIHLFTVELNEDRARACKDNPLIDYSICADAIDGTRLSHKAFGFAMANPPYGTDTEGRLENRFIDRYADVCMTGAIMALVVPHYVLVTEIFLKKLLSKWKPLYIARFDDREYQKFKQVLLLVKRKRKEEEGAGQALVKAFGDEIADVTKLQYLPTEPIKNPLKIPKSRESRIDCFTTKEFNPEIAKSIMLNDAVLRKTISDFIEAPRYTGVNVGNPPVPNNRSHKYLMAVAGVGQGLVGNEDKGDLHLQRGGVVQKNVTTYVVKDGKTIEQEVSAATSSMVIISQDNSGNKPTAIIKELIGEAMVLDEDEEEDCEE